MNRRRSEIILCLLLIMTTLAVYWQVRHHEFLNYDDDDYVTENRHVQAGWTMESLAWAFTSRLHRHWHPLTWLSHMTDCQLFGLNPAGHHLSSVFLHLANALLLFFVLRRMTGALFRSAFVAALFALHPLHVEPVAWVADRKDLLSAFFWILTMWAYVHYAEDPGFKRYVLVFIAFILALMAKSMVVTLPFALLLMDYWPLERFEFRQSREEQNPRNRKGQDARYEGSPAFRLVWEKALFFLIVGACGVVTILFIAPEGALRLNLSQYWPTGSHIANVPVSYVSYVVKMVWPLHLATPYPEQTVVPLWQAGGAGLLLLGISFLVLWQRRRYPYLLVGWLWYLVTLAPVIGLVKVGPHRMADRYTYIPLIGLFVIIAWGVPDILARWPYRRMVLTVSASVVLLGVAMDSWFELRYWKDSMALFRHTLHVTPNNSLADNNLGVAYADEGNLEAAIDHYVEAIRIKPDYAKAHYNLGVALANQGDLEGAIGEYSKVIVMAPAYAAAHHNLGVAVAKQGRLKEAIGHFSEAIRINPNYAEAHYNLGNALARRGSLKEAIGHYMKALKIKPDYAEAHYNLGVALMRQGNPDEAVGHFSEAVRIEPDYAKAHYNLGVVLAEQGRFEEAIGHFSEAVRIDPDFVEARHNLELTLGLTGKSSLGSDTVVGP
jgi:Flp pilus assembly protein TadD